LEDNLLLQYNPHIKIGYKLTWRAHPLVHMQRRCYILVLVHHSFIRPLYFHSSLISKLCYHASIYNFRPTQSQ
jgi:hypothetical protein